MAPKCLERKIFQLLCLIQQKDQSAKRGSKMLSLCASALLYSSLLLLCLYVEVKPPSGLYSGIRHHLTTIKYFNFKENYPTTKVSFKM